MLQMMDHKKEAGPTLVQMAYAQAEDMDLVLQDPPEQKLNQSQK